MENKKIESNRKNTNQTKTIKSKIFNYLPSLVLLCSYFYLSYKVTKYYLFKYEDSVKTINGRYMYIMAFYVSAIILSYIFYAILYCIDNDFIRSFRFKDIPWPWHENPEKWKKMFFRGVKLNVHVLKA